MTQPHEWRAAKPDEAGIWWYRPPIEPNADFEPVEYVPTARPFVIYHATMKYRWLDDPHFEGREWRGPIAKRRKGGGWDLEGFKPA
jgi:hypothetical protein